ncbi:copper chaperone PCu(A)C [Xanthobacter sp. KR7-65]|uniref:copper chaperone PCu(A)C n=1 Tax=Xanthobacter sp. KR7-65 TaxID=3156612 RepID=UPI0032B3C5CF
MLRSRPARPIRPRRILARLYREEVLAATLFALCLLLLSAQRLLAHEYKVGDLLIDHPWARATPLGADVAAGYMVIQNAGAAPDRLVSASAPFATRVELHEMTVTNGVMRMQPLKEGLPIPPGDALVLKPASFHLMFFGLKQPLKEGMMVDATLTFAKAGKVPVQFQVESVGATAGDKMHHPVTH